jgi:4-hydroxybenzoate polyprenyltransferase
MGLKGIFLAILIVFAVYLWRRYRKKSKGKSSRWVDWVLAGIAIYYIILAMMMMFVCN